MARISVLVPAFNCAATIGSTLESVLHQTVMPDEIVVLDDGSTDDTAVVLDHFKSVVRVVRGNHSGAADARNALCATSTGDLIAFVDSDDLWHPTYLETQLSVYERYPNAAAYFTGHIDFAGSDNHSWDANVTSVLGESKVLSAVEFFKEYNRATGPFASMSYCCFPRRSLEETHSQPFWGGVEDSYFLYLLALLNCPVVYTPAPLVAYRITNHSLSANHVRTFGWWVQAFEALDDQYQQSEDRTMVRAFKQAFASKRRQYAKLLMGAHQITKARNQLLKAAMCDGNVLSLAKSITLLLLTFVPPRMQPTWPSGCRHMPINTPNDRYAGA